VSSNETDCIVEKQEAIDYVLRETEKSARDLQELMNKKTTGILIARTNLNKNPTPKANLIVKDSLNSIMPEEIPSGLDTIKYNLDKKNPIN